MWIRALGFLSVVTSIGAPIGLASIGPQSAAIAAIAPGGYLGVRASASQNGQVVVEEVVEGSPAQKSGLKSGDVLVAIDETAIGTVDGLLSTLGAKNAGDRVTVKLKRGQETISAVVHLGQRPADLEAGLPTQAPAAPSPTREREATPPTTAEQRGWLGIYYADAPNGVKVESVVEGGPAAQAGLAAGDVLTAVGKSPVANSSDLISVLEDLRAGDVLTFAVDRGGQRVDVAVTLGTRVDSPTAPMATPAIPATPATPRVERTPNSRAAPSVDEPAAAPNAPGNRMNRARRAVGRVAQAAEPGPGLVLAPGVEVTLRTVKNADGSMSVEVVKGREIHAIKVPEKGTRGFTVERDGDNAVLRLANIPSVQPLRMRFGGQGGGAGGMTTPTPPEPPAMGGGGMAFGGSDMSFSAPTIAVEGGGDEPAAPADDEDQADEADDADEPDADGIFIVTTDGDETAWLDLSDEDVAFPSHGSTTTMGSHDGDRIVEWYVARSGADGKPKVQKAKIAKEKQAGKAMRAKQAAKARKAAEPMPSVPGQPKRLARRATLFPDGAAPSGEWRGLAVPGMPGIMRSGPGGMKWRALALPRHPAPAPERAHGGHGEGAPGAPHGMTMPRHGGPHPRVIIDGDRILIFDRGHGHPGGAAAPAHDIVVQRVGGAAECCADASCCEGGACCDDGACCEGQPSAPSKADVK